MLFWQIDTGCDLNDYKDQEYELTKNILIALDADLLRFHHKAERSILKHSESSRPDETQFNKSKQYPMFWSISSHFLLTQKQQRDQN